jgi:lysophospholipase L1-like esterase
MFQELDAMHVIRCRQPWAACLGIGLAWICGLGEYPCRGQARGDSIALHDVVRPLPGLPYGPFVKLADGAILTIEKTDALISRDEGKTWARTPLLDFAGLSSRPESKLVRTRDGVIVAVIMDDVDRKFTWNHQQNRPESGTHLNVWSVRSADDGKTWDKPRLMQQGYCGCVGGVIQTSDGRLVAVLQDLLFDEARNATVVYVSRDLGQSWHRTATLDIGGRGHHDGAIEGTVVELRDHRLWLLLRTPMDCFYGCHSNDGGMSWSKPTKTDIQASAAPGTLLRLKSGRLMLVWNRLYPQGASSIKRFSGNYYHRPASPHRAELSVAFSPDDGKTWTRPLVIARKPGSSLAYANVFEPSPGLLWITTMQGGLRVAARETDLVQAERAARTTTGPIRTDQYNETIRVACVGDSITYGEGIADREHNSYPAQLGRMLGDEWEVRNFGRNGATLLQDTGRPYWDQKQFADATAFNPHVVIIKLGSNDASPAVWPEHRNAFAATYADMIDHFAGLPAQPRIWVCCPVPMYPRSDWPGHRQRCEYVAREVCPLVRAVAARKQVGLIDLFQPLDNRPEVFPDTVHPNAEGARLIAEEVYQRLTGRRFGADAAPARQAS